MPTCTFSDLYTANNHGFPTYYYIYYYNAYILALLSAQDTVPSSPEIDKYKGLSLKLYTILESCGISADVRHIRREAARINETLNGFVRLTDSYRTYNFGSAYEGSYTLDMESDVDFVNVFHSLPILCQEECSSDLQYPRALLIIPDQRFPGYAKLQCLVNGKEQFTNNRSFVEAFNLSAYGVKFDVKSDSQNRHCLTFIYGPHGDIFGHGASKQHGPALNIKLGPRRKSTDFVFAFECNTWPSLASEWLTMKRENGWPSKDLMEKIRSYGFVVVKACHPQSTEKDIQWRVSFSRQEREFVVNFNMMQMKCYVLLKLIKNDIINKEIGDVTLTSYHCKTCMFYMLENTPKELWIPENLASCVLMCLRQLRLWAMNRNCPNYFIPGENMFDRITSKDNKLKLFEILDTITQSSIENLIVSITTNKIGEKLKSFGNSNPTLTMDMTLYNYTKLCIAEEVLSLTYHLKIIRNVLLRQQYANNIVTFTENIRACA